MGEIHFLHNGRQSNCKPGQWQRRLTFWQAQLLVLSSKDSGIVPDFECVLSEPPYPEFEQAVREFDLSFQAQRVLAEYWLIIVVLQSLLDEPCHESVGIAGVEARKLLGQVREQEAQVPDRETLVQTEFYVGHSQEAERLCALWDKARKP